MGEYVTQGFFSFHLFDHRYRMKGSLQQLEIKLSEEKYRQLMQVFAFMLVCFQSVFLPLTSCFILSFIVHLQPPFTH